VNSSTDTLPNDWNKYASDPTFSIILAWSGNHLENFSTGIDTRSEMLEAEWDSELSDLPAFGGFFGDFVASIFFVCGNRWRTHVGNRYAG